MDLLARPETLFHIILAIFSFGVLCFAGLCALLLAFQDWCVRNKKMLIFIKKLPALETMDILFFQTIKLGFVLLSVVLVTSFYFYHTLIFSHIYLWKKTGLTVIAWLIFAVLLIKHKRNNWKMRSTVYSTFLGISLLIIAIGSMPGVS